MGKLHQELSRRERQIMDVVFRLGKATAPQIRDEIDSPPSYSAVRGLIRVLEEKGALQTIDPGPPKVYEPTVSVRSAGRSALRRVMETFFQDSPERLMVAMLDERESLSEEDLERLTRLLAEAKGRREKDHNG